SDHLSPTISSELAIAQGERGNDLGVAMLKNHVTCQLQVSMLRSPLACKVQVTRGATCRRPSFHLHPIPPHQAAFASASSSSSPSGSCWSSTCCTSSDLHFASERR